MEHWDATGIRLLTTQRCASDLGRHTATPARRPARRIARRVALALLAGALALGLGVRETYLDADGRPCERLCPWG